MKFNFFLLITLFIMLAACGNKASSGYESITTNLTIVNSLESSTLGMINCMNFIDDKLFIGDQNQDKFFIYDAENLTLIDTLGRQGQGPLEFKLARNVLKYGDNIIVNDTANRRIQVLDSQLNLEKTYTVPISWLLKKYNDKLYAANPGFIPEAKIFKLNEDETTEEIINLGAIFDEQKREQMERIFHFWIDNDEIILAMELTNELLKYKGDSEFKSLNNPFKEKKNCTLGDFQPYKKGFLLYAAYPVMDNPLDLEPTFKTNLLYYENDELKRIYEVPAELTFANSYAWAINGNFVYMYDSAETKIYKLKI